MVPTMSLLQPRDHASGHVEEAVPTHWLEEFVVAEAGAPRHPGEHWLLSIHEPIALLTIGRLELIAVIPRCRAHEGQLHKKGHKQAKVGCRETPGRRAQ